MITNGRHSMRKLIGRLIRGQRGFTLLEMATVVTIMA
ncbi:MAG: prepilin-type N-terminal cleavage/methylation domain-containing protein, partial [Chloroflexi bacterium]|nr:prepilin-type N-terminal cleavage/methylation domain-containing protein [Chloroflexota bacterium]